MILGDDIGLKLADAWQRDFPMHGRPYTELGASFGLSENEVLNALSNLSKRGILSRIGPVIRPNTIGVSTLAAMAVSPEELDDVAAMVSAEPAVNHNYEREHHFNLWFVATARDKDTLQATLSHLKDISGCAILDLPLERPYHIDLGFRVTTSRPKIQSQTADPQSTELDEEDRTILGQLSEGLPLAERPFELVAVHLGLTERKLLDRVQSLLDRGVISRFGCILKHRALGYQANAMVVWDVPGDEVDDAGWRLARHEEVTLCYRRTRRPPEWPYNLFIMIHGRQRETVLGQVDAITRSEGLQDMPRAILFSRRCFKQRGALYDTRTTERSEKQQ